MFRLANEHSANLYPERPALENLHRVSKTNAGAAWLEQAFDPFHDRPITEVGLPDNNHGNSVIQTFTRTFTLTAPGNYKWDASVCFLGDLENLRISRANLLYDTPSPTDLGNNPSLHLTSISAVQPGTWGGVTACTGATGLDLSYQGGAGLRLAGSWPFFTGNDPTSQGSDYPSGPYRLVSGGFEIHDTTPELYKSGSVTVWSGPQIPDKNSYYNLFNQAADAFLGKHHVTHVTSDPSSLAKATALPGSQTWEAREGCYVPFRINTRAGMIRPRHHQMMFIDPIDSTSNQITTTLFPQGGAGASDATCMGWSLPTDTQPVGAYLSGLDPNSTFRVVSRFTVEVFPSVNDVKLISLAHPAAPYDPDALAAYDEILRMLPIGVPVAMNSSGDWFKKVMSTVKDVAQKSYGAYKTIKPVLMPLLKAVPQTRAAAGAIEMAEDVGHAVSNAVKIAKKSRPKKKRVTPQGQPQPIPQSMRLELARNATR